MKKRLTKIRSSDRKGTEADPPFLHADHARPVTRREFLGQGFLTGAAYVAAPSILSMLGASKAAAQASCSLTGAGAGKIPFIGFDLGGGANIAGSNVMVGGPLGQEDQLTEGGLRAARLPLDMSPLNSADHRGRPDAEPRVSFRLRDAARHHGQGESCGIGEGRRRHRALSLVERHAEQSAEPDLWNLLRGS